ncbi:MAG: prolipoprotein diacylglyceryl transferase [Candidatus Hydrogenedentes bacterium]|nr:prolipoprotein diacylglyceryl transferase [Candidatus Hydrogenedentota bacterium]
MKPDLITVFGVTFHSYRTVLAVAFAVCTILAVRESRRRGGAVVLTPVLGVWALAGALLGARIFYVLQYECIQALAQALLVWKGGLVFYGGLAGGTLAVAAYCRLRGMRVLPVADIGAPYLALGEAITRIGCFLNGCCYGVACAWPWGVSFPQGSVAYQDHLDAAILGPNLTQTVPLHPTQLYMTAGLVAVFVMLKLLLSKKAWDGSVVCAYLLLYGILRFLVEILRGDSLRGAAGLTLSQSISVAVALAALIALMVQTRRGRAATG